MVTEYDTAAFDAAMEKNATLVVDFFADWCGPCRMLAPVMETLSEEFGDKARFVKINVDDNPELARRFSIMSIPCVMVFKNGALHAQAVGVQTQQKLEEMLQNAL